MHLGLGFTFGLTASLLGIPRAAFFSAGFLIDGVLILIFCIAIIARWSGVRLMGFTAFSLLTLLGVGMGLSSLSSSWWSPCDEVETMYLPDVAVILIRTTRLKADVDEFSDRRGRPCACTVNY